MTEALFRGGGESRSSLLCLAGYILAFPSGLWGVQLVHRRRAEGVNGIMHSGWPVPICMRQVQMGRLFFAYTIHHQPLCSLKIFTPSPFLHRLTSPS